MEFYVKELGKSEASVKSLIFVFCLPARRFCCVTICLIHPCLDVSARAPGPNKKSAAKFCALSLVRQLFHSNVIPAKHDKPVLSKQDYKLMVKPVEVRMENELKKEVTTCLRAFDITPVDWVRRRVGVFFSKSSLSVSKCCKYLSFAA
jgi:hypothetical protein